MNWKTILFSIVIFMAVPTIANATCTYEERDRLGQLANVTQVSYEFDEVTTKYKIIINTLSKDTYISNPSQHINFIYFGNSHIEASGYTPGVTYLLPFYGSRESLCPNVYLITKILYLPAYNAYSKDPLCVGYESYELCKKFTPIRIDSYEDFKTRLNQYISDLKNKPEKNKPDDKPEVEKSFWDRLITFLLDYNLYFLLPIIILGVIGIVIIEVRKKKDVL